MPADLSAAAVHSCDTALGEGMCELEGPAAEPSEFHAVVTGTGAALDTARVDLRRGASGSVLETRQVTFAPEDAPRERWASVGVLIAALVVARSREREPVPPSPTVAPVPPREPRPARAAPRARRTERAVRLDLRGLVSRRTGGNSPEIGGELGGSVLLWGGPSFIALSIVGAHRVRDDPSLSWFSTTAGFGARVTPEAAAIGVELRAALVGEYWLFSASEPGRVEYSGGLRAGGLIGVDALYALQPRWILSLGVEGLLVEPRQRVEIEGHVAERVSEFGAVLLAGVRFVP